jgi:hypothetical protein
MLRSATAMRGLALTAALQGFGQRQNTVRLPLRQGRPRLRHDNDDAERTQGADFHDLIPIYSRDEPIGLLAEAAHETRLRSGFGGWCGNRQLEGNEAADAAGRHCRAGRLHS